MTQTDKIHPPLLTGGWKPSVSLKIDWISGTFINHESVSYPENLNTDAIECNPMNGYNRGARYKDGRFELWHTNRPEMGVHFIWSGETLRNMQVEPLESLKHVIKHGATITRLDLAVDCVNCNLRPSDATEAISKGEVKTRAKQFPLWHDAKAKGYTQYVGKKASEVFCRIYDKASEMGIDGDYTRVECSYGGKKAKVAAQLVAKGADIRGLVRAFVDFPEWRQWGEIMVLPPIAVLGEKKQTNRRKWLIEQVAPAIAQELELDFDDEFWFEFVDAVRLERENVKSRIKDTA